MKVLKLLMILLTFSGLVIAQNVSYSGPDSGFVSTGATVTTDNWPEAPTKIPSDKFKLFANLKVEDNINPNEMVQPLGPEGSNVILDKTGLESVYGDSVFIYNRFPGLDGQVSYIPPDDHLAVGPNHIVQTDNGRFRISDKNGTTLKTVEINSWFNSALNGASAFDPKVMYDHYNNRWVQVWLHYNSSASEAYFLISVSDDDDPMGTWFNWAIPSTTNGNTPAGNWSDYQGVGFDENQIYITGRQFSFAGSKQYDKIRIISNTELYISSNPGTLKWRDLWNISYPNSSTRPDGIRPGIMREANPSNEYYLTVALSSANSLGLYKLFKSPTTGIDSLIGYQIPVTSYSYPNDALQLGISNRISGGGSRIRNEPVYQDGVLHLVHSVTQGSGSGAHYVAIDVTANSAITDFVLGTNSHFHTYPALAVTGNNDVVMTYSRSSSTEYMGAYYTVIPKATQTHVGSRVLEEGKNTYFKDFGSGRNRWGDYMGAWTDPSDPNNIWVMTQYVEKQNIWGNVVAAIRRVPTVDPFIQVSKSSLDFGVKDLGQVSDTQRISLVNFGNQDLEITALTNGISDFNIIGPSLPYSISTLDTLHLDVYFEANNGGSFNDTLVITSNGGNMSESKISLSAITLSKVIAGVLYGSTGRDNATGGSLVTVDPADANTVALGQVAIDLRPLLSLTNNPVDNNLYAHKGSAFTDSEIILLSAGGGYGEVKFQSAVKLLAVAFDTTGVLYGAGRNNKLYTIDASNGDTTYVADLPIKLLAMTFSPKDNSLWATIDIPVEKDRVYKIDVTTGDTTRVGRTGLDQLTRAITFGNGGKLFGVYGSEFQVSTLFTIDEITGEATEVGSTNFKGIVGLASDPTTLTSVKVDNEVIPTKFSLKQNYPNPFNPTTIIEFAIPVSADINVTIFNSIGEKVTELYNGSKTAGAHRINFNAANLSSGIYFYRINAVGVNGKNFVDTKKMMLLK